MMHNGRAAHSGALRRGLMAWRLTALKDLDCVHPTAAAGAGSNGCGNSFIGNVGGLA